MDVGRQTSRKWLAFVFENPHSTRPKQMPACYASFALRDSCQLVLFSWKPKERLHCWLIWFLGGFFTLGLFSCFFFVWSFFLFCLCFVLSRCFVFFSVSLAHLCFLPLRFSLQATRASPSARLRALAFGVGAQREGRWERWMEARPRWAGSVLFSSFCFCVSLFFFFFFEI